MIGKLKERISIINKTSTTGDIGQLIDTWVVSETVWAWLKKINPRFSTEGENKKNEKHYEIIIRDNVSVEITSKIRYKNKFMRIDAFSEVDYNDEYLKLICVQSDNEVVNI